MAYMNDEIDYTNNPLHGLGTKSLLTEVVDHYGFEILFAYLGINCFKTNPSIDSSVKFLKKTDWAREKVEAFYLYEYKNLPSASYDQFSLPPRERVIPEGQMPGEPKELSIEGAERLREKRAKKSAEWSRDKRENRPAAREPWGEKREKRPDAREPWGEKPAKKKIDPWAR